MYWVGDSSVFLNIHFPPPPLPQAFSWTDSWGPTKKIWVTEVLLTSFWERSPRCKLVPPAFSALVFLPLFHVFLPPLRVRHQLGKAWLCFPACCSEACCKMSLAHGGRRTQKHMMYLEKLKIISQGSDSKLCKWEEFHQLQGKAGWK